MKENLALAHGINGIKHALPIEPTCYELGGTNLANSRNYQGSTVYSSGYTPRDIYSRQPPRTTYNSPRYNESSNSEGYMSVFVIDEIRKAAYKPNKGQRTRGKDKSIRIVQGGRSTIPDGNDIKSARNTVLSEKGYRAIIK
jgi:hypothetical protein